MDNRKFSLFQYPNPVDLHWSWQNDTANATYTAGVLSNFFTSGGWTHLAVTYQNPNIKIYRNGQLYHSATGVSNSSSFAYLLNAAKSKSTHRKMEGKLYYHLLPFRKYSGDIWCSWAYIWICFWINSKFNI